MENFREPRKYNNCDRKRYLDIIQNNLLFIKFFKWMPNSWLFNYFRVNRVPKFGTACSDLSLHYAGANKENMKFDRAACLMYLRATWPQAWAIPPPSWGLLSQWHRQQTTTTETNEASSARTQRYSYYMKKMSKLYYLFNPLMPMILYKGR